MKRTISAMVGKGSVNHNSRKFNAENVDYTRSEYNADYCNENIKTVYKNLFGEALKRYNEKQNRADRKIENYYEKIRNSKQEKTFHELILQVGNKDDMNAQTEEGEHAAKILNEYFNSFQKRNPYLKVFSAHLHMDEATPHLHIDFVPFTTNSRQGLDTRVSLKQALFNQGFKGGTRSDTEWNQWVLSEKEQLAFVMERHGVEWEQKGTHEKHLSVLDYEKQERAKEVTELEVAIDDKKDTICKLNEEVDDLMSGANIMTSVENSFRDEAEYQLQEPQALMSAKAYKIKIVEPLIERLKIFTLKVLSKYFEIKGAKEYYENQSERWKNKAESLENKSNNLEREVVNYRFLRKVFGNEKIDNLLNEATEIERAKVAEQEFAAVKAAIAKQSSRHISLNKRSKNNDYER